MVTVIGVDPGARETGIVVRSDTTLLAACVVSRGRNQSFGSYAREVGDSVTTYDAQHHCSLIRVEDVNPPVFWASQRILNLTGLLGTARLIGALEARFPDLEMVQPAGYGSHPLLCYPRELVGKETRGRGIMRHTRSAWDITWAKGVCAGESLS